MMRAMVVRAPGKPLALEERPMPEPAPGELLIAVAACGVCRTDLHVADGDLPQAHYPVVPGHEVVGTVAALGAGVTGWRIGERVGVPWLGSACGHCPYCEMARENLCDTPTFTGCSRDGGFASHMCADAAFCLRLPQNFDDIEGAPLLCAGLIGYRSYRMAGKGRRLGLYGFGAAAHIIAQVAIADGREVYAFTRAGDTRSQEFARALGAVWAGPSDAPPCAELDAAILFAPVGALVPEALKRVRKGGRVVCAGIHMSDIPGFPYADLWGEREILSVANLTREDGHAFLAHMARAPVSVHTRRYRLEDANRALDDLRAGDLDGAAVLVP